LLLVLVVLGEDYQKEFAQFKQKFHRTYPDTTTENLHYNYFVSNVQRINHLNKLNGASVFGITAFADRVPGSKAYARGRENHGHSEKSHLIPVKTPDVPLTATKDWRDTPYVVSAVKNQGQCGSCWAFSATEQIESQLVLSGAQPVELSPQQVASCTLNIDGCCDGCGGGDTVIAYEYLMQSTTVGLSPRGFWPYAQSLIPTGECLDISCTQQCSTYNLSDLTEYSFYIGPYASLKGYTYATTPCTGACASQNLTMLAASLSVAPVSICVNAGNWDDYTGGVMTSAACGGYAYGDLDHCVQLVGYESTGATPYWIVRNSWSAGWGENGYIRLQFDANSCGLADEATQVQVGAAYL